MAKNPVAEVVTEPEFEEDDIEMSFQTTIILSELYNRALGAKDAAESAKAVLDGLNEAFTRELRSVATFNGLPSEETQFQLDFNQRIMKARYPKGKRRDLSMSIGALTGDSLSITNLLDTKKKEFAIN